MPVNPFNATCVQQRKRILNCRRFIRYEYANDNKSFRSSSSTFSFSTQISIKFSATRNVNMFRINSSRLRLMFRASFIYFLFTNSFVSRIQTRKKNSRKVSGICVESDIGGKRERKGGRGIHSRRKSDNPIVFIVVIKWTSIAEFVPICD